MRKTRIYIPEIKLSTKSVFLDLKQSHYVATVLRSKLGETIYCFNSNDSMEYRTVISKLNRNEIQLVIEDVVLVNNESPVHINLFQALSSSDKLDYVIQKSTELGVKSITPLITTRVNYKLNRDKLTKKLHHWQKIAISATEQCGRVFYPKINSPSTLIRTSCTAVKADYKPHLALILDPKSNHNLNRLTTCDKPGSVSLYVGPEGGWTDSEIITLRENGVQSIRLGPRILRTETAPVSIISMINYLWGDF